MFCFVFVCSVTFFSVNHSFNNHAFFLSFLISFFLSFFFAFFLSFFFAFLLSFFFAFFRLFFLSFLLSFFFAYLLCFFIFFFLSFFVSFRPFDIFTELFIPFCEKELILSLTLWSKMEKNTDKMAIQSFTVPRARE